MGRGALCIVLLVTACDGGNVTLLTPEGASADEVTALRVVVDSSFADFATSLGWNEGVPGATVRLHRTEEPYDDTYWMTATSDTTGRIALPGLLAGLYEVEVSKALSGPEQAVGGSPTLLVAGGRLIRLPVDQADIPVQPNVGGTLVFSEVAVTGPLPWEVGGGNYDDGKFLEFYNNSTETVYLDGMLVGVAYRFNRDSSFRPCDANEGILNDPQGIWTKHVLRFPGTGGQFPIEPGGVVLVAKSAVDHRPIHVSLQDLTDADFEWSGARTADNPAVPNLEDVGPTPLYTNLPIGEDPIFLASPVDLKGLPAWTQPYDGYRYVRIPAAAILDAVVPAYDFTRSSFEPTQRCLHSLNASFERLPGPALWSGSAEAAYSLQRRVLGDSPIGTPLLQDTNTSMADFVRAMVTPGTIKQVPPGG